MQMNTLTQITLSSSTTIIITMNHEEVHDHISGLSAGEGANDIVQKAIIGGSAAAGAIAIIIIVIVIVVVVSKKNKKPTSRGITFCWFVSLVLFQILLSCILSYINTLFIFSISVVLSF